METIEDLHFKDNAFTAWFYNAINEKAKQIVNDNKEPTKLKLKYPFIIKKGLKPIVFSSTYGYLTIIIDEKMKELIKVE